MEIIVLEVSRLERLVDEVLGYSRITNPEYKISNVNALIQSVVATMQDEISRNSIQLKLELAHDLPQARIDELQVRQALMNLVTNALEAMPSGGTLTISTAKEGEYLEIGVSDTGVGIPKEYWKKLFTPFFTTKITGTGLGLAIVSQVIDNHSGSLRFQSLPGKGTSFHIRLAFHPEGGGAAYKEQNKERPPAAN